jgi:hypothetical protein
VGQTLTSAAEQKKPKRLFTKGQEAPAYDMPTVRYDRIDNFDMLVQVTTA